MATQGQVFGAPYPAGQYPGTATNNNAVAGNLGEYIYSSCGSTTFTVTISIASPAVITQASHDYAGVVAIIFTTTGALPTGLTASTVYYTGASTTPGQPFSVATTADNAIAGTFINTSGSQSGVQTANTQFGVTSGVQINIAALPLTAGDWDVCLNNRLLAGATTLITGGDISFSFVSATRRAVAGFMTRMNATGGIATAFSLLTGPLRISVASSTTVYIVLNPTFTTSTMDQVQIYAAARRMR